MQGGFAIVPAIAVGILFVFALYNLYRIYALNRKIKASQSWPQASGTVTNAEVHSNYTKNGGRHYFALINYVYLVLGSEYQGKLKRDSFFGMQNKAQAAVDETPAGASIQVRYNPEKPQESITGYEKVRGGDIAINVILFLAVIIAAVGFAFL